MIVLPTRLPYYDYGFTARSSTPGSYVATHTHPNFELVLVAQGQVASQINGRSIPGAPGTLYILPPGVPHDQSAEGAWTTHCVLFDQTTSPILDTTPRTLDISGDARLCRWIADLCDVQPYLSSSGWNSDIREIASSLLLTVLRTITYLERQDQLRGTMHPQLLRAVEFLTTHITEDIALHDLADFACVSGSHLSALFRHQFGCGPLHYQQRLRMETARVLLRNPYLSIEEVAQQCGYCDANYFARLFRSVTGVRPSQWRREAITS